MYQNPHTSSRDTNDGDDSKEGGDEDEQVYEDHDVDVDGTHQADKDLVEPEIDPLDDQSHMDPKLALTLLEV